MVFYRKYRPQTIEELDSSQLRATLTAVLSSGLPRLLGKRTQLSSTPSVPHAFLFTGPKGLGKTSTARILAKAINCQLRVKSEELRAKSSEEPKEINNNLIPIEPCNQCEQCLAITSGRSLDVLEIDGASNRGIDEIRDLKEKINLAPVSAFKKIYIIDEVHMLTTEAFNALLKTIEEPPSHVVFIFCTTEPNKVPATILSRCFHINFLPATQTELVRSFKRIVNLEKIAIDDQALLAIASLSDHGFRDGVKILEELAILAQDKLITKDFVEKNFNIQAATENILKLLEFLSDRATKSALQLLLKLKEQGIDFKYLTSQILLVLNAVLLQKLEIAQAELEASELVAKLSIEDLKLLFELFSEAQKESKYAILPELPLEMVVMAWGENKNRSTEEIIKQSAKSTMASLLTKQKALQVKKALGREEAVAENLKNKEEMTVHEQTDLHQQPDEKTSLLDNLIYKVKSHNNSLAGVLRGCKVKEFNDTNLVIQTAYQFHQERLEEAKALVLLEEAMREISGKKVKISVELSNKGVKKNV